MAIMIILIRCAEHHAQNDSIFYAILAASFFCREELASVYFLPFIVYNEPWQAPNENISGDYQ